MVIPHAWRMVTWLVIVAMVLQLPAPALVRASTQKVVQQPVVRINEPNVATKPISDQPTKDQQLYSPPPADTPRVNAPLYDSNEEGGTGIIKVYDFQPNTCPITATESTLPYELDTDQVDPGQDGPEKYICVPPEGGAAAIDIHADVLGFTPAYGAFFRSCHLGACHDDVITPTMETLWVGGTYGWCRHQRATIEGTFYFPPSENGSLYAIKIWGRAGADNPCAGRSPHMNLYMDVSSPAPGTESSGPEDTDGECPNKDKCIPDPVNTRTGSFTRQETDITIPTRGLPLAFERTYSSVGIGNGPLGPGWTHSYNMQINNREAPIVRVIAAHGSKLYFHHNGDTFTPLPGVAATLTLSDSIYTLTTREHVAYLFDSDGRLTGVRDQNGNETMLEYPDGLLRTITAPDRRYITLDYNDAGHITKLTDPIGRVITYTYTTETKNGRLETVTDFMGGVTTYVYTDVMGSQ